MSDKNDRTSLAGEFYVMSQLFLHGLTPTLTLGNKKGVDIVVLNSETNKTYLVEVKSSIKKSANSSIFGHNWEWTMGAKHENCAQDNLIFCFVKFVGDHPDLYIVHSSEVAPYCKEQHQKWLKAPREGTVKDSDMRTFRIPIENTEKYKDNFKLFQR